MPPGSGEVPPRSGARTTIGGFMRVWLPCCIYKSFPLFVGSIGLMGCFMGNTAGLALGGLLIGYSAGVCCMRLQYSQA